MSEANFEGSSLGDFPDIPTAWIDRYAHESTDNKDITWHLGYLFSKFGRAEVLLAELLGIPKIERGSVGVKVASGSLTPEVNALAVFHEALQPLRNLFVHGAMVVGEFDVRIHHSPNSQGMARAWGQAASFSPEFLAEQKARLKGMICKNPEDKIIRSRVNHEMSQVGDVGLRMVTLTSDAVWWYAHVWGVFAEELARQHLEHHDSFELFSTEI